jgi:hypothetical protein
MAAVAAIANAPQNVIRKMAFPIGAPPSDADSPPKEVKKTKLRLETTHGIATKLGDSPLVFKIVNDCLVTLYEDEELFSEATIRIFRIVQTEENRQVSRLVDPYRLAILSVNSTPRLG